MDTAKAVVSLLPAVLVAHDLSKGASTRSRGSRLLYICSLNRGGHLQGTSYVAADKSSTLSCYGG